jgi:DNA repair exonuclease SbcCD nuclease subunit
MQLSDNVALISDIHLGIHQDTSAWHDVALKYAADLKDKLKSRGITEIIIPGDIFHNRSEVSVNTLQTAYDFFNVLKDFKILITVGNHDCYYKDRSDVNSVSILRSSQIKVVDQLEMLQAHGKSIALVPWATPLDKVPKCDIIIGHFEIVGFYLNSFRVCDHGYNTRNFLDKASTIISGHFHKPDHRVYDKGQILYVGSPYQQTFADVDGVNGCFIFNIPKEKVEELIPNTISPKHFKIKLSHILNKTLTVDYLKQIVPGNIISLLADADVSLEQVTTLSAKLHALNPMQIRTDFNYESISFNHEKEIDLTAVDIATSIVDFVSTLEIDNKQEINEYLLDLYKKHNK